MLALRQHLAAPLLAFALTAVVAQPSAGQPESSAPVRSARNANYSIEVRLNPRMRTLDAAERITWRNITHAATSELQFHLYWNAWINTKSTFLKERGRSASGRPASDFARLDITSLTLLGGDSPIDLTASQRFIAPDDGNGDDRTVMAVSLPRPVQPGETIEIELAWNARVPRPFDRTGVIGSYYFLAQWFPKLGVLEDSGWNCHQFHAGTEFFSDYGVYDVRMTTPAGWTVGATGIERDAHENGGGTTVHHFVQEDVHDFAWTVSPDFIVRTERFDEPGLPPVDMRLLMQPEHIGQAARHFAATRSALRRYGQWYGSVPYGHITIVDPAFQSRSDGMEYPTLITGGTSWLLPRGVTLGTPEETVLHETGHQFWYGLVGTNEFENGWMDEGVNTFSTARALAADFPEMYVERRYFGRLVPWAFPDLRLSRETDVGRLWGYRQGATSDVITTPTFRLRPRDVEHLAYDKPSAWLATMERWLGWPALQSAMHAFFEQGEFRHPGPDEFLAEVQHATNRNLSPFLDQVYRGSAVFDYSLDSLTSTRSGSRYSTHVIARRLGDGVFPVDVVVTFSNGEQATEHWDGARRWREFTWDRAVEARSAAVDPNRTLLLDINFTNNSRTLRPRADVAASRWTLKWMVWLEDALLSWGMLA